MKRRKNKEHSDLIRKYDAIKSLIGLYLRRIKIDKDFLSKAVFDPWGEYDSFENQLRYLQSILDDDRFLFNTYSKEARELKIQIKEAQRKYGKGCY